MSRLTPELLPLDKGLNLQTAKIIAPAGSVLDSLNYEQVDFQGQKRIDGYARYDGSVLPAFDDFILVAADTTTDARGNMFNEDGVAFAQYLGDYEDFSVGAVYNENALPDDAQWGRDVIEDVTEHYEAVLQYTQNLRNIIESLPGRVIGLHWFRDRLYAVANMALLEVAGTVDILPNDSLGNGVTALGTFLSGTNTYVIVDSEDASSIASITVERTGTTYSVARVTEGGSASFFESRTEQQVLDEDGPSGPYDWGWRFKHLGWAVPFENGTSSFGELVSLNQNRQGVGIQGPTSVSGDNGRPLVLVQKVEITNGTPQVNGWKTSTSPTVYSLEASALRSIDDENIYGDMFISWTANSSVVSAPGADGNNLVEYSPTNSVVVEV